jgi:hypothetical protein
MGMKFSGLLIACALANFGCTDRATVNPSSNSQSEAGSSANKGSEAMAEYLKRDQAPFRKNRVRFTISSEDDPQKIFEIDTLRKQAGTDTLTVTQIVKPAEESDLASLTIESEGKPTSVTTYVASMDEFRETDTGRMFFGGLTAGELLGEWNKFDYRLIGEKAVDGQQMLELEGKLKKPSSSLIAKMNILMRADNYLPVDIQMFDAGGRHLRSYKVSEVKTDSKGPYASRTEIENLVYKTKVVVDVLNREFPSNADESIFTRDRLKKISARSK